MENKCTNCGILFDIPCVTYGCLGHRNERVGDICAYCDVNERENVLFLRTLSPALFSSLEAFEFDLESM